VSNTRGKLIPCRRSYAGRLRQAPIGHDDIDIAGGIERAERRNAIAETLDGKALLQQRVGQGLAIEMVVLYE